jgi:hypothetical protein
LVLGAAGVSLALMPGPRPPHSDSAETLANPNLLIIDSVSGYNYLFGIFTPSGQRLEFTNGEFEGQGKIFVHSDQHVPTLLLQGASRYSQELPVGGRIKLRFFRDSTGGQVWVAWHGRVQEISLQSSLRGGEWLEVTLP